MYFDGSGKALFCRMDSAQDAIICTNILCGTNI